MLACSWYSLVTIVVMLRSGRLRTPSLIPEISYPKCPDALSGPASLPFTWNTTLFLRIKAVGSWSSSLTPFYSQVRRM